MTPADFDDRESWQIFALFFNYIIADIGITKAHGLGVPELSPQQFTAVFLMAIERRPITVSEFARGLGISLARASRVVDDLVRDGLVLRDRSEEDRRQLKLQLTPQALQVTNLMWDNRKVPIRKTLDGFTADEMSVVHRFLGSIIDNYKQVEAASGSGSGSGG